MLQCSWQAETLPMDEIESVIHKYDMCVVKDYRLTSDILSRAKKLKVVTQFGMGLEGTLSHLCPPSHDSTGGQNDWGGQWNMSFKRTSPPSVLMMSSSVDALQ